MKRETIQRVLMTIALVAVAAAGGRWLWEGGWRRIVEGPLIIPKPMGSTLVGGEDRREALRRALNGGGVEVTRIEYYGEGGVMVTLRWSMEDFGRGEEALERARGRGVIAAYQEMDEGDWQDQFFTSDDDYIVRYAVKWP